MAVTGLPPLLSEAGEVARSLCLHTWYHVLPWSECLPSKLETL